MKKILLILVLVVFLSGCDLFKEESKTYSEEYFKDAYKCVLKAVNEGRHIIAYDEKVLYLVPISKENGCTLDFDDNKYNYAFVGFTYDNSKGSYNYYLYVRDRDGNGYYDVPITASSTTIPFAKVENNENLVTYYNSLLTLNDQKHTIKEGYTIKVFGSDIINKLEI